MKKTIKKLSAKTIAKANSVKGGNGILPKYCRPSGRLQAIATTDKYILSKKLN